MLKINLKVKYLLIKNIKDINLKHINLLLTSGLLKTVGEEPVLYDSINLNKNIDKINDYLFTKGFYNSNTSYEIKHKNKKTHIEFNIDLKKAYKINNVVFQINDPNIRNKILNSKKTTLLKKGTRYNEVKFEKERDRITSLLRNKGYFEFNKNYISFDVDTTIGNHNVDVKIKIGNYISKTDSISIIHPIYKVKEINIYVDCKTIILKLKGHCYL